MNSLLPLKLFGRPLIANAVLPHVLGVVHLPRAVLARAALEARLSAGTIALSSTALVAALPHAAGRETRRGITDGGM